MSEKSEEYTDIPGSTVFNYSFNVPSITHAPPQLQSAPVVSLQVTLTEANMEQIRQMIREEILALKTELFKEFERHLEQQFRLGAGVNHGL